ncbi:hypothetical protein I4F81_005297 [Pyropia yezoensis]|uniref:Uncharacterized protein n=1 Tax=Pyropia yezoensis TaxID=2788 RepID=A0ACC3BYA1_PYRYE|nr:hypothetical protein I4F81_005297 [Neopyropia yezoensis]
MPADVILPPSRLVAGVGGRAAPLACRRRARAPAPAGRTPRPPPPRAATYRQPAHAAPPPHTCVTPWPCAPGRGEGGRVAARAPVRGCSRGGGGGGGGGGVAWGGGRGRRSGVRAPHRRRQTAEQGGGRVPATCTCPGSG